MRRGEAGMSIVEQVAGYVREQGKESNDAIHISQVAAALGLSIQQVTSARSEATRRYDDIFPCATSAMVYEPGWKEIHPEVWQEAQDRTRRISAGKLASASSRARQAPPRKPKSILPNIIGPVVTLHNVVAVNIYADRVSIQHEDGTWTDFAGELTLQNSGGR